MPQFTRHIFVCTNARAAGHPKGSCGEKGADEVLGALKAELRRKGAGADIRANKSGCLDCCEHGIALVVYPEGTWYRGVTLADVAELVEEHILGGRVVERLRMPGTEPQSV